MKNLIKTFITIIIISLILNIIFAQNNTSQNILDINEKPIDGQKIEEYSTFAYTSMLILIGISAIAGLSALILTWQYYGFKVMLKTLGIIIMLSAILTFIFIIS